jgi:hypothetical protein
VAHRFGYHNIGCYFISISKAYFDFVKYNWLRMHHFTGSAHHVLRKVCRVLELYSTVNFLLHGQLINEYENISEQFAFPSALGKY